MYAKYLNKFLNLIGNLLLASWSCSRVVRSLQSLKLENAFFKYLDYSLLFDTLSKSSHCRTDTQRDRSQSPDRTRKLIFLYEEKD